MLNYMYAKKIAERYLGWFNNNLVDAEDKKLVRSFFDKCLANGLSWHRVNIYLRNLKQIVKLINKPLHVWTKEDVNLVVIYINNRTEISEWTRFLYLLTLRKFFQHVYGYDWNSKNYPEIVEWIPVKVNKTKLKKLKPNDIITKKELTLIISKCDNIRDKALISLLYEAGIRSYGNGAIILSHMCRYYDIEKVKEILEIISSMGYTSVTIDDGISPDDKRPEKIIPDYSFSKKMI